MTGGEWYHCFKRLFGGGAGAGSSRACSLVIGPYNRAASALPLTSQWGGTPPPPPSPHHPPCLSSAEAPQLSSPASALPIAQTHTARPWLRLTAALSSACQAYANKELSIHHALECQLSLCFLPSPPFFFLSSLCPTVSLYFLHYLSYSSALTLLSVRLSVFHSLWLHLFSSLTLPPCSWVS